MAGGGGTMKGGSVAGARPKHAGGAGTSGGSRGGPSLVPIGRPSLVPIGTLVEMLAARVASLVRELLPGGIRDGHEWRCGSLGGEKGRSLAVHLGSGKAGVWSDFSTGECGDALDLVAQTLFRGDKAAAIGWARGWLGLDGTDPAALSRTRAEVARRDVERDAAERRAGDDPEADARRARDNALRIWLGAAERLADTPVEAYLAGRAIDLRRLGRQPRALRYHAALWNRESGRHWPALVALISDGGGGVMAVHRTWLAVQPSGRVTKAPLDQPKMVLGGYRGGSIRVWRGLSGKPLAKAPAGETLVLAEGIEDGLSVAVGCPELRVLSAISLGNLGAVQLPPQIGPVIVCVDNDEHPKTRDAMSRKLAQLATRHEVRVARSAIGKDFNDWLRGGAAP